MKLEELVDKLETQHILVVGDAIEDVYIFGHVDRMCPEAPVPVFTADRIESRHGGAFHTSDQVSALGITSALMGWPMSQKFRYMAGHHMLLRYDKDAKPSLTSDEMLNNFEEQPAHRPPFTGVILSDYGKGALDEVMCQYFIKMAKKLGIPVFVDPKGSDWSKYRGADWVCPNEKEWAERAADTCTAQVLRKRGAKGLQIGDTEFPSHAREVFDVTGAGDTVVAVFAMAICAGADPGTAATLANLAAGWTVSQLGTVCISHETFKAVARIHDEEVAESAAERRRKLN